MSETPPRRSDTRAEDGQARPGIAEKVYDQIENGLGQGTIAMIAFIVALPIVVVAAHCLML